jgi:hypothetical protein
MDSLSQSKAEGPKETRPTSGLEDSESAVHNGKPTVKAKPYLDVPLQPTFARSSDTISDISTYSSDNEHERRTGRLLTVSSGHRLPSRSPAPPKTLKARAQAFWITNKGLALVILAQLFGVMMNVTTRLLEMDGRHGAGMHPFQVCKIPTCVVFLGSSRYLRYCSPE